MCKSTVKGFFFLFYEYHTHIHIESLEPLEPLIPLAGMDFMWHNIVHMLSIYFKILFVRMFLGRKHWQLLMMNQLKQQLQAYNIANNIMHTPCHTMTYHTYEYMVCTKGLIEFLFFMLAFCKA